MRMVRPIPLFLLGHLLFILAATSCGGMSDEDDSVRDACSVTRYQDLCVHSLASFSSSAKRSPYKWARAAVSVTITEAKNTSLYLASLGQEGGRRGMKSTRARMGLQDCMECLQDALDELYDSLSELRRLESETFASQMENVETWMSSALTNEDTCLEGFSGRKGGRARDVAARVANVTYFTSNALALVTKLASSGDGDFTDP